MDRNKREATEIHNDGYRLFREFLGRLTEAYKQNLDTPINLQLVLKNLIDMGKDTIQDQDRPLEKDVEGNQSSVQEIKDTEDDSETRTSCQARPLERDVEGKTSSVKEIKDDVKVTFVDTEDEGETRNSSQARSLEEKLRLCQRELETKESEIESLKRRMAQYGDRQTKQYQRVENTLSLNRQSRVEQDFKEFASHERIDACKKITKGYKEKTDINARKLTCMMFEIVYEYVLATKGSMTDAFKEISKFVIENGPGIGHYRFERLKTRHETRDEPIVKIPLLRSSGSGFSRDVLDGLLLSVKESAPEVDTDIFMKGIKIEILRLAQERKGKRTCKLIPSISMEILNHMDDYLKACIKLTWRMVTQAPPLKLEYQTFGFHRDYHKIHAEACADGLEGQEVCYLWPGLVDGGGKKIILGEVILK